MIVWIGYVQLMCTRPTRAQWTLRKKRRASVRARRRRTSGRSLYSLHMDAAHSSRRQWYPGRWAVGSAEPRSIVQSRRCPATRIVRRPGSPLRILPSRRLLRVPALSREEAACADRNPSSHEASDHEGSFTPCQARPDRHTRDRTC